MMPSTLPSVLSVSLLVLGLVSATPAGPAPTSPRESRDFFKPQAKDVEMRCGGVAWRGSDPTHDCYEAAGDMQKEFQVPGQWESFVKVQWWRESEQRTTRFGGTAQQVPTSWTAGRCTLTIDYTPTGRDKLPKQAVSVRPLHIVGVVKDLAKKCVATDKQTEGAANLVKRGWITPDKDTLLAVWIDIDSKKQGVKGKKCQPTRLQTAASCPALNTIGEQEDEFVTPNGSPKAGGSPKASEIPTFNGNSA